MQCDAQEALNAAGGGKVQVDVNEQDRSAPGANRPPPGADSGARGTARNIKFRYQAQSIWFQNSQAWEIKSRLFDFSSLPSFSLSHSGRGRSGGQSSLRARAGGSVRRAERERKRERAGRSKRARRKEAESSNSSGSQQASRASKDSERAKRARQRERRASKASGEEKERVRMV